MDFPLGIDLVEIKKAKSFYILHKNRLATFFSGEEISYIEKNKKPYEALAVLLAAKEATFKALPKRSWMGVSGFKQIVVTPGVNPRALRCRLKGEPKAGNKLKLSFTKNKKFVVARCVGIS